MWNRRRYDDVSHKPAPSEAATAGKTNDDEAQKVLSGNELTEELMPLAECLAATAAFDPQVDYIRVLRSILYHLEHGFSEGNQAARLDED